MLELTRSGSIFDTNLWLLDGQLQRLRGDLRSWPSKIDDLWVGWEIRRMAPPTMPINTVNFENVTGNYHRAMNRQKEVYEKEKIIAQDTPNTCNLNVHLIVRNEQTSYNIKL